MHVEIMQIWCPTLNFATEIIQEGCSQVYKIHFLKTTNYLVPIDKLIEIIAIFANEFQVPYV